ncbi:actinodin3 [Brachyhypopomus gauderio]|uniref:actinodin3 n=1 Tax=Brachyhypopomus gauderio TaxID=698409 RepID=UPI004041683C
MTPINSIFGTLSCFLILPISRSSVDVVSTDSAQAHNFLKHSRPRRNADPKWYHQDPNFQAYYSYYSSIGHHEGLYEVDRIRILYQQMRHLEHIYGTDASKYQNALGLQFTNTNRSPLSHLVTKPPPPNPTKPPPLSRANVTYLCNPKDPLCKPHVVYLPSGAVPVACDPRYHPDCKLGAAMEPPPPPPKLETPAKRPSAAPPASPIIIKRMEYDCDPYWDPDCLTESPAKPVSVSSATLPTQNGREDGKR